MTLVYSSQPSRLHRLSRRAIFLGIDYASNEAAKHDGQQLSMDGPTIWHRPNGVAVTAWPGYSYRHRMTYRQVIDGLHGLVLLLEQTRRFEAMKVEVVVGEQEYGALQIY